MLRLKYAFGVPLLIAFQSGALAADYANSCQFSFEKAVYDITSKCQMTFYKGETILTYQNKPIDNTADCTHDRDVGPMGGEEADKLYMKLSNVIFADNGAGKPRVSGSLKFNPAKNGIDSLVGFVLDGKNRGGSQFIKETGNNIFPLGPFTFSLGKTPYMKMMLADATMVHLKGKCDGPYFGRMKLANESMSLSAVKPQHIKHISIIRRKA